MYSINYVVFGFFGFGIEDPGLESGVWEHRRELRSSATVGFNVWLATLGHGI